MPILMFIAWWAILTAWPAYAHDHGQFGQYSAARDSWLRSQTNPNTKVLCCDGNDSTLVNEDIRYDAKGVGHYWIRWGQYDWTQVPDETVLPQGNPNGEPVVWFYPQVDSEGKETPIIRCYAPGAGI